MKRDGAFQLVVALVVLAIGASLLIVRSGDDGEGAILVRAGEAAKAQHTFRYTIKQEVKGLQRGGATPEFKIDGATDLDSGLSRSVLTATGAGIALRCTYIASKDTLFTSVHESRRATLGAPWLRSDIKAFPGGAVGLGFGSFNFQPDRFIENPSDLVLELERSGTAVVRGVSTTRYRGKLDPSALLPGASPVPDVRRLTIDIPVEFLIDGDGLLRRMTTEFGTKQASTFGLKTTMELYDYGKPVDVKEPPVSDVKEGTFIQTASACQPAGPKL